MVRVVTVGVILLILLPMVFAAEQTVDTTSRLLTAQVIQQMEQQKQEMLVELKAYQDENFLALDGQMRQLMNDTKTKVFVGGIGVILVANAIVAIVMTYFWRKYSYQTYVEQYGAAMQQHAVQAPGQQSWEGFTQPPLDNITSQIGEGPAAQVNRMNEWQSKPAYSGSWVPPVDRIMLDDDLPIGQGEKKPFELERLKIETEREEFEELMRAGGQGQ
jgi:hypothetical protein